MTHDPNGTGVIRSTPAWLVWLCRGCIIAFAIAWNWKVGHRGLFLFDQSTVFDGAWRILQGQVPYRDFFTPFGPVTYWLQAAVFWLFGVSISSTVLAAAISSGIATACVMAISRVLFPELWWPELAGGLATAICFQAPFGTFWMEQCSFLFGLLAMLAILCGGRTSGMRRFALFAISGACSVAAVLSKQNAGGLIGLVVGGLVLVDALPDGPRVLRNATAWIAGILASASFFFLWLKLFSNVRIFYTYFFEIAGSIGVARIHSATAMLRAIVFPKTPRDLYVISLFAWFGGSALLLLSAPNRRGEAEWVRPVRTAAFLAVALMCCQNLFVYSTYNEAANGYPYAGLCLGLLGGAAARACARLRFTVDFGEGEMWPVRVPSLPVVAITLLLTAWTSADRLTDDWWRTVQQFDRHTKFDRKLQIANASIYWGDPTDSSSHTVLRKEDLESTFNYLKACDKPFFVFKDATIFYGLTGRPSPQPLLYFQENHSFRDSDVPWLDARIVDSLERNHIQVLVIETSSWLRDTALYEKFPRLEQWMKSGFQKQATFGIYEVWKRNEDFTENPRDPKMHDQEIQGIKPD